MDCSVLEKWSQWQSEEGIESGEPRCRKHYLEKDWECLSERREADLRQRKQEITECAN